MVGDRTEGRQVKGAARTWGSQITGRGGEGEGESADGTGLFGKVIKSISAKLWAGTCWRGVCAYTCSPPRCDGRTRRWLGLVR